MKNVKPSIFKFKKDVHVPNSGFPLLIYADAFEQEGDKAAEWLENTFKSNTWTNSWRWGIYPYHHYHSNTHEVLGVYSGSALLQLGGENGKKFKVKMGHILVIPAGVGHKCVDHSDDFKVVGAYPDGLKPDLIKGDEEIPSFVKKNLDAVLFPSADPLLGENAGIINIWGML